MRKRAMTDDTWGIEDRERIVYKVLNKFKIDCNLKTGL